MKNDNKTALTIGGCALAFVFLSVNAVVSPTITIDDLRSKVLECKSDILRGQAALVAQQKNVGSARQEAVSRVAAIKQGLSDAKRQLDAMQASATQQIQGVRAKLKTEASKTQELVKDVTNKNQKARDAVATLRGAAHTEDDQRKVAQLVQDTNKTADAVDAVIASAASASSDAAGISETLVQ